MCVWHSVVCTCMYGIVCVCLCACVIAYGIMYVCMQVCVCVCTYGIVYTYYVCACMCVCSLVLSGLGNKASVCVTLINVCVHLSMDNMQHGSIIHDLSVCVCVCSSMPCSDGMTALLNTFHLFRVPWWWIRLVG